MAKTTSRSSSGYIREYKDGSRATFTKAPGTKGRAKKTGMSGSHKPRKK